MVLRLQISLMSSRVLPLLLVQGPRWFNVTLYTNLCSPPVSLQISNGAL